MKLSLPSSSAPFLAEVLLRIGWSGRGESEGVKATHTVLCAARRKQTSYRYIHARTETGRTLIAPPLGHVTGPCPQSGLTDQTGRLCPTAPQGLEPGFPPSCPRCHLHFADSFWERTLFQHRTGDTRKPKGSFRSLQAQEGDARRRGNPGRGQQVHATRPPRAHEPGATRLGPSRLDPDGARLRLTVLAASSRESCTHVDGVHAEPGESPGPGAERVHAPGRLCPALRS